MQSPKHAANPSPPVAGAVLVVQRWNSWVRVLDTESGLTRWVNLAETRFEPASPDAARAFAPALTREGD